MALKLCTALSVLAWASLYTYAVDAAGLTNTAFSCEGITYQSSNGLVKLDSWTKKGSPPEAGRCGASRPANNPRIEDLYALSPSMTRTLSDGSTRTYNILIPCWDIDGTGYCCGDRAISSRPLPQGGSFDVECSGTN